VDIGLCVATQRQPDHATCGPTSLHAVDSYFGDRITLPEVIDGVQEHEGGGTPRVHLAVHALRSGHRSKDLSVSVADPLHGTKYCCAGVHRQIGAIFLGSASDDANVLMIQPKRRKPPTSGRV